MRVYWFFAVALALVVAARPAQAETFRVPGDSDTIQGAIDLADGDDVIVIKKGTYKESVRIENLNGITLCAKGKVVIDNGSDDTGIVIVNSNNVTIKRFTIRNTEDGIEVDDSNDVTISKCSFMNNDGEGVDAVSCERLRIEKCKFDFTDGSNGITLSDVNDSTIEKCKFARIGETTIEILNGSDNRVLRNKSKGSEDGISLRGGSRNLFEGNQVVAAEGDAFQSSGLGSENVWRKNKAQRVSGDGIVERGDGNRWEGNTLIRMGSNGLRASGDNNTFRGNKLTQSLDNGVECRGTGNAFENNKVDRSRVDGFEMREGGNTLTGNKIKRSVAFDINDGSRDLPTPNVYIGNKFKTSTPAGIQPGK